MCSLAVARPKGTCSTWAPACWPGSSISCTLSRLAPPEPSSQWPSRSAGASRPRTIKSATRPPALAGERRLQALEDEPLGCSHRGGLGGVGGVVPDAEQCLAERLHVAARTRGRLSSAFRRGGLC